MSDTIHDRRKIKCKINDMVYESEIESRLLLVHYLRDTLNITGTHVGCDTGHCGACTVLLNGRTIKSCMVLAAQTHNSEIKTIEGMQAEPIVRSIKEKFNEHHALQCGYCTPGMIMSSYYLLKSNQNPTTEEIKTAIEGNLCMCTGYVNIIRAISSLAQPHGSKMSQEEHPLAQ